MNTKLKSFSQKNPSTWQFLKYMIFSLLSGLIEVGIFMLLNYILPNQGINKAINWFLFVYPTEAGGLGALLAFVISSVIGQALKFIINFKKTFKSTNNILISAVGFAVMAVLIVVGLNLYVGGILNTALCKVIANADLAGALAKAICQVTGFFLSFPVNKYVIMRTKKTEEEVAPKKEALE